MLRLIYGVLMGTSTHYIKKSQRPLLSIEFVECGGVWLAIGGTHNCGILHHEGKILLIDTGSLAMASQLKLFIDQRWANAQVTVILQTHHHSEAAGGSEIFSHSAEIYRAAEIPASEPKQIIFGSQLIELQACPGLCGSSNVIVNLRQARLAFLGQLFFNQIHPILRIEEGIDVKIWTQTLRQLSGRAGVDHWIGAEGPLGSKADVMLFADYLRDLSDPNIEFSHCRSRYDWKEIPAITSLEENFELLRHHQQTHLTL